MEEILDLGAQPLANTYPAEPTEMPAYPLRLQICHACFHGQQAVAVDPEALFSDYAYVSGTSQTLKDYFTDFVLRTERAHGGKNLRVLDIACNDGSLLAAFKARGHDVCGVDPAQNLTPLAEAQGIKTHTAFWTSDFAKTLDTSFDIIIAMNVLAHVPNPLDFLLGCRRALAPGGILFVQTSQANMLVNGEFDTIYHEHHSFFHTRSMQMLASRADLNLCDASHRPIHGTSYLWQLTHEKKQKTNVTDMLELEKDRGYFDRASLHKFAHDARDRAEKTHKRILDMANKGAHIAGYGAAAKAVVFLNFAGINLDFIIDDSPMKQERFLPGRNIPIVAPEHAKHIPHSLFWVITAWNFRDEIARRIKTLRPQQDDRFLVYFPQPEIFS